MVTVAAVAGLMANSLPTYAQLPPVSGGLYKDPFHPLGQVNDNLDKHHIPSANSYKSAPTKHRDCGPAILMPRADHVQTASNANSAEARAFRQAQADKMGAGDFAGAMQMDIDNIRSLQAQGKLQYNYDQAIQQAIDAMNIWMADCNQRRMTNPPASSGATAAPGTITAGSTVSVSASGLATGLDEYDAVIADASNLSQDPNWQASPRIISVKPILTNGAGSIPPQSLQVGGTFYWESGGEQDTLGLSPGQAKIGFLNGNGTRAANPATTNIATC